MLGRVRVLIIIEKVLVLQGCGQVRGTRLWRSRLQRLRIIVAVFLLSIVARQTLLTAISAEADELGAQVVVVPISAVDLLYPLSSVNVIIIIGSEHATNGLGRLLLDRIAAIGLVLIVWLVEARALRLSVSDNDLVIIDDVLKRRNTCVVKLSGASRGEQSPCLIDELIPENDLLFQSVDLGIPDFELHISLLMLRARFNVLDYLDAFFHHELEDFEMHLMHTPILEPFLRHVIPLCEQVLEAGLIVGQPGLNMVDLRTDIVNLLIDNLDLDIGASLLLDDQTTLGLLVMQTPLLTLQLLHGVVDLLLYLELFFKVLLELLSLCLNLVQTQIFLLETW